MTQASVHIELADLVRLGERARGLELGAQHRALSAQAGGYVSVYRGRGLEFDEARIYQAGDDARSIDWRLTARRGKPHTKLFREERERPVLILVDLHPGMYFGTRRQFKSVLAARAAALIAWAALHAGDRVGGLVHGPHKTQLLKPRSRRAGVLALLHTLEQLQPTGPGEWIPGRLDMALERLQHIAHPGSLVLMFSDFREFSPASENSLALLSRHNDMILGIVSDPLESAPPPPGQYHLGTPSWQTWIDTRARHNQTIWQHSHEQHQAWLQHLCQRHRLHPIALSTAQDPLQELRNGLARHGTRR